MPVQRLGLTFVVPTLQDEGIIYPTASEWEYVFKYILGPPWLESASGQVFKELRTVRLMEHGLVCSVRRRAARMLQLWARRFSDSGVRLEDEVGGLLG